MRDAVSEYARSMKCVSPVRAGTTDGWVECGSLSSGSMGDGDPLRELGYSVLRAKAARQAVQGEQARADAEQPPAGSGRQRWQQLHHSERRQNDGGGLQE